jgi:uncharacterized membrane protein required for colicin V production
MNIVDYVILAIIALSILWGFYRGFIQSVLSMGAVILALIGSFLIYPQVANMIQSNQDIARSLIHYTDASSRLGDLELSVAQVGTLTQSTIGNIMQNIKLPTPINTILQYNLENQVFSKAGISTVAEYVNQTIVAVSINILSFFLCFLVLYLVMSILINMLRAVFHFPLLKQLDWLAGGVFGALRGVVICYAVFALVPLLMTVVPFEQFSELIDQSTLAKVFNNGDLIMSIINRRF